MFEIIDYYIQNGGIINIAIFLIAVATIYIGTGKLILYYSIKKNKKICNLSFNEKKGLSNKKIFVFFAEKNFSRREYSPTYYKNRFKEILLEKIPVIEDGLDTMAALTGAAPLLGLLGTVIGMIKTFTLITTYGSSNPVILTKGITVSLLTTQAGLLVAFPCLLFHNYVSSKKNELIDEIIKQGEQLLANKTLIKGDDNA